MKAKLKVAEFVFHNYGDSGGRCFATSNDATANHMGEDVATEKTSATAS
jgi:hypothetical protein